MNYTKAPFCFYLSALGSVEKTGASSNYFREILSIAEREAAQASHVCPIKIGNGPICSALIRFLPAETAIIFLSLGFSCGPVVLQTCHMHKAVCFLVKEKGGEKKRETSLMCLPAILVWKKAGERAQGKIAAGGLLNIAP